jgi:hypothetical protein
MVSADTFAVDATAKEWQNPKFIKLFGKPAAS